MYSVEFFSSLHGRTSGTMWNYLPARCMLRQNDPAAQWGASPVCLEVSYVYDSTITFPGIGVARIFDAGLHS